MRKKQERESLDDNCAGIRIYITQSKTLPDESIVFECTCGKTIARVVDKGGYRKLKMMLKGRTRLPEGYRIGRFDSPETPEMTAIRANLEAKYLASRKEIHHYNITIPLGGYELGGICPLCHQHVCLDAICVLQSLGFEGYDDFLKEYDAWGGGTEVNPMLVFQQFVFSEFHDASFVGGEFVFGEVRIMTSKKQKIIKPT